MKAAPVDSDSFNSKRLLMPKRPSRKCLTRTSMDAPFVVTLPRTVSDPSDPHMVEIVAVTVVALTSLAVETEVVMNLAETEAVTAIDPLLVVATTTKSLA